MQASPIAQPPPNCFGHSVSSMPGRQYYHYSSVSLQNRLSLNKINAKCMIVGHDAIRRRIPSCSCSKEWRPFSPVLMSLLHPVAMAISTLTIRVNGFRPSIALVFAVWTMRPRMIAAPIWYMLSWCSSRPSNPYLWTFKDNVIEETLLNLLSLPFALWFIINRNDSEALNCAYNHKYQEFWDAFYIIAAAGGVSLILLICMMLHFCNRIRNASYNTNGLSGFWKGTLTIAGLNMLLAFVGQWLLWSGKSYRLLLSTLNLLLMFMNHSIHHQCRYGFLPRKSPGRRCGVGGRPLRRCARSTTCRRSGLN